jgi:hypothetical protein
VTALRVPLPLDHVGWLVGDLDAQRRELRRVGFAVTSPGMLKTGDAATEAADVGQQSAHVMFQDTYLELTAVAAGARPAHLVPYLDRRGLIILALRVTDGEAARATLDEAGLAVSASAHSERPITYPEPAQQGMAHFRWFMCAAEQFPELLVCCVEHVTPELVFQPAMARHDVHVIGLRSVFLFDPDAARAAERYGRLADVALPGGQGEGELVMMDGAALADRFVGFAEPLQPGAVGIGLRVADVGGIARHLAAAGVAAVRDGPRLWCRGPEGTVLEFAA